MNKPFDSIFKAGESLTWGRDAETPQTFIISDYYFDLNNLFKLEEVENACELAVVEAGASRWGVIDFKI